MMIRIFDYVFFRIAFLFRQLSVVGDLSSITIISIVETWNLLAIFNIVLKTLGKESNISDLFLLIIVASFLIIINSIRYLRIKKYQDLHSIWIGEDSKSKIKRGALILTYIVLSLALFVLS